jgi:hypothetical protein
MSDCAADGFGAFGRLREDVAGCGEIATSARIFDGRWKSRIVAVSVGCARRRVNPI